MTSEASIARRGYAPELDAPSIGIQYPVRPTIWAKIVPCGGTTSGANCEAIAMRVPKRTFADERTDLSFTAFRHHFDGNRPADRIDACMAKLPSVPEEDIAALTVRVPRALVSDIDQERRARAVRVPRNTWILEAVVEKLDREKHSKRNGAGRGADDGQE